MMTAVTTTSKLLVRLKDPTGRKRAQARQHALRMAGAASAGALLALAAGLLERRRRRQRRQVEVDAAATQARAKVRTAGTTDDSGTYHSRHGAGAGPVAGTSAGLIPMRGRAPLDQLTAQAERLQTWGGDEPGFRAHLGFGVGGSIPGDAHTAASDRAAEERVGGAMPTGGGDALGGTVRGGDDVGYADEIVTGAGEAISNSTTPAQNGRGSLR